jgi:hypothetical protein
MLVWIDIIVLFLMFEKNGMTISKIEYKWISWEYAIDICRLVSDFYSSFELLPTTGVVQWKSNWSGVGAFSKELLQCKTLGKMLEGNIAWFLFTILETNDYEVSKYARHRKLISLHTQPNRFNHSTSSSLRLLISFASYQTARLLPLPQSTPYPWLQNMSAKVKFVFPVINSSPHLPISSRQTAYVSNPKMIENLSKNMRKDQMFLCNKPKY